MIAIRALLQRSFAAVENRWILGLFAAISLALAGLIGIQVHWLRTTLELKQAQFDQNVDNALLAVSDRLERVDRLGGLRNNERGRALLDRLDTLRQASALSGQGMNTSRWATLEEQHLSALGFDSVGHGSLLGSVAQDEYESLVTDVVRSILGSEVQQPLNERIDPALLDSLLTHELANIGLVGAHPFGVFTATQQAVPLSGDSEDDRAALAGSPYRVRLFRHDMVGQSYFLHVLVPAGESSVLSGVAPMLGITALFLLVILGAFAHTVRTILKQKRIGQIRSDLVNNLTHELKTPISTIGLACEALSDPSLPRTDEQVKRFTNMIRDENKRLGSLVENVLQSAVLEDGQMVIKRVDLDLHNLIRDVVRSSSMQVSRRNGNVEMELNAELHHISGDRIHLTNLLYNLIDNAIKYTEQEPKIRIRTSSNNERVTLSVSDNGIGIPSSEHRKIFDRLYRVPTGNIHNTKGFGLGLSYVKNVVERHNGRIRLESQPGKGSTFHIELPFEHVRSDTPSSR